MFYRLFPCVFFILVLLMGCSGNDCTKTCPYPNMACYQNVCVCRAGWEGAKCDSVTANKYVGIYKSVGNCVITDHLCEIVKAPLASADVDRIEITNFLNLGINVFAYVDNTNVTIPNQLQDSYNISGDGYYETNTKNFNFIIQYYDFTNQRSCNIKLIRQ